MLAALKFVQGSIAKKDFVPELTHFLIEDGRVSGFNGILALSSPIPFNIACKPRADPLIKAIANCTDTVQLSMTAAGKLTVKSGSFKVHIQSIEGDTPHVKPEGGVVQFDGEAFYKGIQAIAPFVGTDASRKWAQGILVKDKSLFATNNVMLVQYWLGVDFPQLINIPFPAVKEMLRIKEAPLYAQVAENSITFHYSGDRWLRTQLYSLTEWPDLGRILNVPSNPLPIQEVLFEGLEVIKPFVDKIGSVYINNGMITTHIDESEGASYEVAGLDNEGLFQIEYLSLLKGSATHIDWSLYPKPCLFTGGMLRGAITGMRR
jgi:hypothetical protein